jgi:hypothetical protein
MIMMVRSKIREANAMKMIKIFVYLLSITVLVLLALLYINISA